MASGCAPGGFSRVEKLAYRSLAGLRTIENLYQAKATEPRPMAAPGGVMPGGNRAGGGLDWG